VYLETNDGKTVAAQEEAHKVCADIHPPWVVFTGQVRWTQGYEQSWWRNIWMPFWDRLTEEERIVYVIKWKAPNYWPAVLLNKGQLDWLDRLRYRILRTPEKPSWLWWPDRSGVEQGAGEAWLDVNWQPYWNPMNEEERIAYAIKWNAPDAWLQTMSGALVSFPTRRSTMPETALPKNGAQTTRAVVEQAASDPHDGYEAAVYALNIADRLTADQVCADTGPRCANVVPDAIRHGVVVEGEQGPGSLECHS
jgi:hypothetical protein